MNILNRSGQKGERACTTPQRMRLVQSIKKSIHRSIQKINPSQYKNLLKGQYIFMHLCHKGQLINSQYTKVAMFMGAVVLKKAIDKITVIVTNDPSNKAVKKLALMGKPVLSVLWLQACFQEKRKVQYQDFLFQDVKDSNIEDDKEDENHYNLQPLVSRFEAKIASLCIRFEKMHNTKYLRFVDKKQKMEKNKDKILVPHEIDIGQYQPNRRKSIVNSDRVQKKKYEKHQKVEKNQKNQKNQRNQRNQRKKEEIKSEGGELGSKHQNGQTGRQQQDIKGETGEYQQVDGQRDKKEQFNKRIYEKYLKDFNIYEAKLKEAEKVQQINVQFNQDLTPWFPTTQPISIGSTTNAFAVECNPSQAQTPKKSKDSSYCSEYPKTHSIKRAQNKNIPISIIQPTLSQKLQKINLQREQHMLPIFQMAGNQNQNTLCIINQQSKVQAILALLSKPKKILSQKFILNLQKNPLIEVNEDLIIQFQVKCKLNSAILQCKKVVLLDSVLGNACLTRAMKECNAQVLGLSDYLFCKGNVDIVITNKKMYMKSDKENYRVLSQASFIDEIVSIQK